MFSSLLPAHVRILWLVARPEAHQKNKDIERDDRRQPNPISRGTLPLIDVCQNITILKVLDTGLVSFLNCKSYFPFLIEVFDLKI